MSILTKIRFFTKGALTTTMIFTCAILAWDVWYMHEKNDELTKKLNTYEKDNKDIPVMKVVQDA